jgi:hypothetical protein
MSRAKSGRRSWKDRDLPTPAGPREGQPTAMAAKNKPSFHHARYKRRGQGEPGKLSKCQRSRVARLPETLRDVSRRPCSPPHCCGWRNQRWHSSTSRDPSWSALARLDLTPPSKAGPSRSQPTATRPSWAGHDNFITGIGYIGAAWVFTRSGGVRSQHAKLVGSGAAARREQHRLRVLPLWQ